MNSAQSSTSSPSPSSSSPSSPSSTAGLARRKLGGSDVLVTPIIFGAWAIGGWMWGGSDEADSLEAIRASIDAGVTTLDTAPVYGAGYSEELVGKALKDLGPAGRDKVQIATKCGMRWDLAEGSEPWPQKNNKGEDIVIYKNSRPHSVLHECEQSLRRLGIEAIDVYQVHWPDKSTPVEDTMRALAQLKQQGKIRAIGVSNYPVDWLQGAIKVTRVDSDQPPYSLIQRKHESDVLLFCRQHNIGVIVYSPLERGLLTGKVSPDRTFPPGDHRAAHKFFTIENRKRVLSSLERIKPIADRHNASYTQLVINWTVHEPGITAAIVGARNAEQAKHNAASLTFTLSDQERSEIRAAFDETSRVMTA